MPKNIFTYAFAVLIILSLCCKNDPPTKPVPTNTVNLSLDYAECKEIGLKLSFTDVGQPKVYALLRDGHQILTGTLVSTETSLVDTVVVPGHDYIYIAQRLDDSKVYDASTPLTVHSLDSTSHNVQWQVDTLGAQGVICDVWMFDKNNAWAVGEIYLRDSTGNIDNATRYNVAKWNGTKWTLEKIQYATEFNAIFAFSTTDVWTCTSAPYHWDGSTWKSYNVTGLFNGYAYGLWGTSSNNLYMVGGNGSIAHYNGTTWSKMTSNTTVDLEDIYGLDANHIWATGTNADYSRSVVLFYDGNTWKTIYDDQLLTPSKRYEFSSLWTSRGKSLYLAGICGAGIMNASTGEYKSITTPAQWIMYRIGATSTADIFTTGQNSEIVHFNGSTWKLYGEIQSLTMNNVWWYSIKVKEDCLLIGGSYYTGYNSAPIVVRGYR